MTLHSCWDTLCMPSFLPTDLVWSSTATSPTWILQHSEKTVHATHTLPHSTVYQTVQNRLTSQLCPLAGSNGTYRRDDLTVGDFTLRVIAYDPLRGDMAVIRARLWVHSTDLNDLFCIMYLKNRGWGVSGTTFSVDFTGTGTASAANGGGFECSVDRKTPETC